MAAPAHYIRSIHSSFSAHSPSSAWASATATAQYHLNHHNSLTHTHAPNPNTPSSPISHNHSLPRQHHSNQLGYVAQGFTHTPSISTHNTHMYTHHLRDLTHSPSPQRSSGAQGPTPPPGMVMTQQGQFIPGPQQRLAGRAKTPLPSRTPPSPPPSSRRRSVSIRMPPSYKFDPFGDEPAMPAGFASSGGGGVSAMPLTSSSQANRALSLSPAVVPETVCAPEPEMEVDISSAAPAPNQPYTIHIPAAAPNDIKLYTPSPAPRLSARAPSFTPALTPSPGSATPKTYSRTSQSYPAPNLSKIVAGILLNRVHAAKPMRRRAGPGSAGRQYVKSCLSSVVSVEA